MDDLTIPQLQKNIIKFLQEYLDFLGNDPESELQLIIDESNHHYL
jgi:hypothetical protein